MRVTKKIQLTKRISIIFWDEQSPNIRLLYTDIRSFQELKEHLVWKKRSKKHTLVQKITKFIIKRIAMYLIHQVEKTSYDGTYKKAKIVNKLEGIDFYNACHDKQTKKYCHGGTMFWVCYLQGYTFFGHTEYGLYLEIIRRIILEPIRFPFA